MPQQPDIAGYQQALQEKRQALGEDVTFHFPEVDAWPEGTVLDPETGRPYDPLVKPTKEEAATPITLKCSVAFKPALRNLAQDTADTAIGDIKQNHCLVWVSLGAEWESVEKAVSFDAKGDNYLIRKVTRDGIGGDFRMLIWGERQGDPLGG